MKSKTPLRSDSANPIQLDPPISSLPRLSKAEEAALERLRAATEPRREGAVMVLGFPL